MTTTTINRTGISRQRGFWLRCFLGLTLAALFMGTKGFAQLDLPKPFRVSHFEGVVISPYGKPVENADVSLSQNNKTIFSTRTDAAGHFKLDNVEGQFVFHVKTPEYSVVMRDVVIGFEIATAIHGNRLYVILGPGACAVDCSSVFTHKGDFNKAMHKLATHNKK